MEISSWMFDRGLRAPRVGRYERVLELHLNASVAYRIVILCVLWVKGLLSAIIKYGVLPNVIGGMRPLE